MAIYLDNGATSFPKPPQVAQRMADYITRVGANINRSVYGAAQEAGLVTLQLRERLCRVLGYGGRPTHAVLTAGNTMSLNMILQGYLRPGDHCLVSSMEHNAVMRPLTVLTARGVTFDRIPSDGCGRMDVSAIAGLIRPNTRLLVMAHGSNVCGVVQDAEAVGAICRDYGIAFVLDAAQTAGHLPLSFDRFGCSAMTVPGHKGLMGPSGIGGLMMTADFAKSLSPLLTGGTGSASHTEVQPGFMPDKFESGTPNLPGIYGWEAALHWLEETTVDAVRTHDLELSRQFLAGLQTLSGIRLLGPETLHDRVAVFSLDFPGQDNAAVGDRLEREFGILTRCGLHCAPHAHKTLGTYPGGTVRFSFGWYNTADDVDAALQAIACLTKGEHHG